MRACKVLRITLLRKTPRGVGHSPILNARSFPIWSAPDLGAHVPRCCCALLLLVLLAILKLLEFPRRDDSRRLNPLSRLPNKSRESQRQLLDSFRLPSLDRFRRNQLAADANRRSSRQNIAPCCLLIHASRGNQRNLWQRRFHGANVPIATHIGARKNFHEIRACFPSFDNLARSQRSGNRRDVISVRELHNLQALPWARQKSRASVQSFLRKLHS